jgi:hypothetical protein
MATKGNHMSGVLRVATAQLRELAAKRRQAVAGIRSAIEVADGVDTSVRITHGVIAWVTAGSGTKGVAEEMADKLDASAGAYDTVDGMAGGRLGDRTPTR